MKRTLLIFLAGIATHSGLKAQCNEYPPLKEGTLWEWTMYDKKGKEAGKTIQEVTAFSETADGYELTLNVQHQDKKGEKSPPMEMTMACRNGAIYVDMKNFVPAEYLSGEDGEVTIKVEGDNLSYPVDMKAGDLLPDASIKVSLNEMMNMTINIRNRKVEGQETITTPAGTFDSYVISQTTKTKMVVTMAFDSKDWYVPGIGSVRSESYKKGKLQSYSLLTRFDKK